MVEAIARHRAMAIFGLMALSIALVYGNSLQNGFVYDDELLIVKNGLITRLDTLPTLIASDYWITRFHPFGDPPPPTSSGLYRPLVSLSYALNYALGGLSPVGYHLVNVLLHLAVTWVLYLLALQLRFSQEAAAVAALLFALHPLHTEAVANVVGRAELFMALGVLGALLAHARGRPALALLSIALALCSKEQAIVLPALLLLYDFNAHGHAARNPEPRTSNLAPRTLVKPYLGYLLILSAYLTLRWWALGGLALPPTSLVDNPLGTLPWLLRLLTAFKVAWYYLWLFLWPATLSLDYSYNAVPAAQSFLEPAVVFGLFSWGSLAAASVWAYRRGRRRLAFAIGFTILAFVPVSNVVVLIGTIMGERLFYLPSAGLCLLAGLGYAALRRATCDKRTCDVRRAKFGDDDLLDPGLKTSGVTTWNLERRTLDPEPPTSNLERLLAFRFTSHVAPFLVTAICLALAARTIVRNQDWFSNETAFQSAYLVVPESAKVRVVLGKMAASKREWGPANRFFADALQLNPAYSLSDTELMPTIGGARMMAGDLDSALDILQRAVARDRQNEAAQYNLGLAYIKSERHEEAEEAIRRHLALAPDSVEGYNSLSYAIMRQKRYLEAEAMAAEAIRRRPAFAEAHYNRGRALEGLARRWEAIAEYKQVIALSPWEEKVKARLVALQREQP